MNETIFYRVKNSKTRESRLVPARDRDEAIARSGFDPVQVRWAWQIPKTVTSKQGAVSGKDQEKRRQK